jgi:hypothetical protein
MEQREQESIAALMSGEEECLLCRVTYSIFSTFPAMPSAMAMNIETEEFFPPDRLRSYPTGYDMAAALGYAWACNCCERAQRADYGMARSLRGGSLRVPGNLGNAQAFEYDGDDPPYVGEADELAGTTNEKYARKMFGYDRSTFREMIHRFKKRNRIGAADNLEFEKNGDVYFRGIYVDHFHD